MLLTPFYGAPHFVLMGVMQHAGLAEDVLDHRLNCRTGLCLFFLALKCFVCSLTLRVCFFSLHKSLFGVYLLEYVSIYFVFICDNYVF